jgi:TonB family protein
MPGKTFADVSRPSSDVPYPTSIVFPRYPPRGLGSHMVLVEIELDAGGSMVDAKIISSAQGFDAEALDAARRWRWRPARRKGGAVASVAYILFGFREPVAKIRP